MTGAANDRSGGTDKAASFPSEREWRSLPSPWSDELDKTNDEAPRPQSADAEEKPFADRVIRARREERAIDHELRSLDRTLSPEALRRLAAPTPSAGFAARAAHRVDEQRRKHWAEALARNVAREPSPEFVTRTLDAIASTPPGDSAYPRSGRPLHAAPRSRTPPWGLLSAAAAASLWFALTDRAPPPLELRIADQSPAMAAYADAPSPMAAILAAIADEEEPHATVTAPADGVWLHGEARRPR